MDRDEIAPSGTRTNDLTAFEVLDPVRESLQFSIESAHRSGVASLAQLDG